MTHTWKVFIRHKPGAVDHRGAEVARECSRAGLKSVKKVHAGQAYELAGSPSEADVRRLADKLLADPVTQDAHVSAPAAVAAPKGARLVQIWPKTGVSDPVGDTVRLAAKDLGVEGFSLVRSGQVFEFHGAAAPKDLLKFCEEHLMNSMVQRAEVL